MSQLTLNDRASYAVKSTREYTPEGFLKAHGKIFRTGIQNYYGYELGRTDKPFKLFSVYRPESAVFDSGLLDSVNGIDITNDHPATDISSKTYKALTVGVATSKGVKDSAAPNYVACDLVIKDEDAIHAVEAGKCELSAGYKTDFEWKDGVTPEGQHYDGVISSIRLNHIAIVARGRAGGARILDGVEMKKLTIGGVELELADSVCDAVNKHIADMQDKASKAETALKDAQAKIEASVKDKAASDAKIAKLEQELKDAQAKVLTDAQISERIKTVAAVRDAAAKLAGDGFKCDSVDPVEIKRAALSAKFSDKDFKDNSADYITAFFDAMGETQAAAEKSTKALGDAIAKGVKDGCASKDGDKSARDKAIEKTCNAWKRTDSKKN